jgi:exosortase
MLLLLVSAAIHIVARRLDVWFPSAFASVGAFAGMLWWLFGWTTVKHFWFPIAYLIFAIPLERFLVLQFAQPLQLGASTVAAVLARGAGLPVRQVGTSVQLPDYTFEVGIPCSGLKSAIAMSALAALLGFVASGPTWGRIAIFLAGVPMALVGNAARILLVLVLAQAISPAAADGFFHTLSGLLVFGVAFLGLLGLSRAVSCTAIRSDL